MNSTRRGFLGLLSGLPFGARVRQAVSKEREPAANPERYDFGITKYGELFKIDCCVSCGETHEDIANDKFIKCIGDCGRKTKNANEAVEMAMRKLGL